MSSTAEPELAVEPEPRSLRSDVLSASLSAFTVEKINDIIEAALKTEKRVKVQCSHCRKYHETRVPDDVRRLEAVERILEMVEGRLKSAETDSAGVMIVVERKTPAYGESQETPVP